VTTNLPVPNIPDECVLVDTVTHWIDLVAVALKSETGRLRLQQTFREYLRQGDEQMTMRILEAARAGHQDADQSLRDYIREKMHRDEFSQLPPALKTYAQEALYRPLAVYPAGRNLADTWMRDVGIAVLVSMAVIHWPPLSATRSRVSKRPRPSACSVVSAALNQRGYPLGERQVERIYGDHNKLAARLSASIPS
jgi:hypothetical protein